MESRSQSKASGSAGWFSKCFGALKPVLNDRGRTPGHKPVLAVFSALGSAWVFVLVTLGAFTTSINAGMAFPDWPLSNGSLNPSGWLTNVSMFAEHSHRLSASTMGIITVVLGIWLWLREERSWLRRMGAWAIGLVILQGVIGGLRVLLDPVKVTGFEMTLGQMLRIPHGVIAQVYVCLLISIAAACSRAWIERPVAVSAGVRRLGRICVVLLFIQLTIAAVMRHNNAGLAIPSFPWSTPDGGLLPAVWSFKVAIQFAHRVMACILAAGLVWLAAKIWLARAAPLFMRPAASFLVSLLALQILLGAAIIRTYRDPAITTAHVLVGALVLATAFWLTWFAHRDWIETKWER
jgi:cytochrome c oxidase assembly protein subunit 15